MWVGHCAPNTNASCLRPRQSNPDVVRRWGEGEGNYGRGNEAGVRGDWGVGKGIRETGKGREREIRGRGNEAR